MQRFKKILLIHDPRPEEKTGYWRAVELAKCNEAQITLLEVIRAVPGVHTTGAGTDVHEAILQDLRQQLDEWVEPVREEGVEVTTTVRVGRSSLEIIRAVLQDGHDLVIKTAQGSMGFTGRLFGSTALRLARKCPCPVLIVKPSPRGPYRGILAAVDPCGGPEPVSLARKILEISTSLADRHASELHVVHAWRSDDSALSGRLPQSYRIRASEQTRSDHENALMDLLAEFDKRSVHSHVHFENGHATQVILSKAEELGTDLVVMGAVSQAGIAGLFTGNTAEDVLQCVDRSVLIVKPDGFVSPVTLPGENEH